MVEINLLPWREFKKAYEKKITRLYILSGLLIGLLVTMPAHFFLGYQIKLSTNKTYQLQEKLQRYFQSHPAPILAHYITQSILDYGNTTQKFFLELSHSYQEQACFTEIVRHDNVIQMTGLTPSPIDLTEFLKNWHLGKLFSQIKIDSLQPSSMDLWQFRLQVSVQGKPDLSSLEGSS